MNKYFAPIMLLLCSLPTFADTLFETDTAPWFGVSTSYSNASYEPFYSTGYYSPYSANGPVATYGVADPYFGSNGAGCWCHACSGYGYYGNAAY